MVMKLQSYEDIQKRIDRIDIQKREANKSKKEKEDVKKNGGNEID